MRTKRCHYCFKEKPADGQHYDKHPETYDGYANRCKVCQAEYWREYRTRLTPEQRLKRADWQRAKRRARRQERESKIEMLVLRLCNDEGWTLDEWRKSKFQSTICIILRRDGERQKLRFAWRHKDEPVMERLAL